MQALVSRTEHSRTKANCKTNTCVVSNFTDTPTFTCCITSPLTCNSIRFLRTNPAELNHVNPSNYNSLSLAGGCCGDTNLGLAPIKLDIVFAHEHVAKNPKRAIRRRDVDAHKADDASGTLSCQCKVALCQGKGLATESERQVWDACVAIHGPFLPHEGLSPELVRDDGDLILRASQKRRARVDDGLFTRRH